MKNQTFTLERSMSRTVAAEDWGNWRVCSHSGSHIHASLASFDNALALCEKLNAVCEVVNHSPELVFAFVCGNAYQIATALREDQIAEGYAQDAEDPRASEHDSFIVIP